MKLLSIFILLLVLAVLPVSAQKVNKSNNAVKVNLQGTDASILINTIDLIGTWKNTASAAQILNNSFTISSIEITNGRTLIVNDAWREDYPNKMKNCTWAIIDDELQLRSPDLGRVKIEIEKLENSNFYEFTLNNVTYRKLVNVSNN